MKKTECNGESGYSLVESLVALALLATVLTFMSSFIVSLSTKRMSRQKIEALSIAQSAMEEALSTRFISERSETSQKGVWLVAEESRVLDDLLIFKISVSRAGKEKPQVTLRTVRLLPYFRK